MCCKFGPSIRIKASKNTKDQFQDIFYPSIVKKIYPVAITSP
ncbi:hypothetical protein LHK_01981 [Laribacter hongkongensis HLHK9]|uniref:Uncharacterized protein n=2 Tax=Laribacter hongkongensis TaxID=168471 RepID=C1D925_LARHH|nr:hypothetical protein LHK_01981 [Laribacter hongkongensis HLHK9]ASJ24901.1 hypothetical protein LHGZ1_2070 [Laribacter hongkongensis]